MSHIWIYLAFIITVVQLCNARVGFVKDQSITKIKFPPILKKQPTMPMGHLRPFGWHRSPESEIAREKGMLDAAEFFDKYVNQTKPVVFQGAISGVPAMKTWQKDEYLKKTYGHLEVHATVKKELLDRGIKKTTMKQFLREYNFEDWYLSNIIPQQMKHELTLPGCLSCGFIEYLQESEIWMSSGGTVSLIHSHADHNLHCVMAGRKDFILVNPKHKDKINFINRPPHKGSGYCDIGDLERMDMFKYPRIAEVPWSWSTLSPGDCIFIPAVYLHQVRSYGRSFSSTILWAPTIDVEFSRCSKQQEVIPLDKVPFIWDYLHADRELTNRKLDHVTLKQHLVVWMRNEPGLVVEVFKDYFKEIMSELPKEEVPDVSEAWGRLTGGDHKQRLVTRDALDDVPEADLTQLAVTLNKAHEYHGHAPDKQEHDEL